MSNQQILDTQQLRHVFVHHLNRLYFGKRLLDTKIENLILSASLPNLQLALAEMRDDVQRQVCKMDEIFTMINESPLDEDCNPIKSIIQDQFFLDQEQSVQPMLKDIDIILYVQLLEHVNITSYRMLKMLGHVFELKEIDQLLIECFDESVDDDRMFAMIAEEYLPKK